MRNLVVVDLTNIYMFVFNHQATELTFPSGIRVTYKRTDHLADEVVMQAFAVGGYTEVPRKLLPTAKFGSLLARVAGPFGHKPELLGDILAG